MKYQGGKARIARRIVDAIREDSPGRSRWVEPFVGGAWVLEQAARHFEHLHAGDAMPDVIMLYQSVADGWDPPREVTREMYEELKDAEPSALRALVGFGSSYGGMFFAGFCGDSLNGKRTNAQIAADHLVRRRPVFQRTDLRIADYREWEALLGPDTVLYCDPPYDGTCGYRGVDKFSSSDFWKWCAYSAAASGAAVFVSEYQGPDPSLGLKVREVWSRAAKQTVARYRNAEVTERLFRVEGLA